MNGNLVLWVNSSYLNFSASYVRDVDKNEIETKGADDGEKSTPRNVSGDMNPTGFRI